MDRTTPSRRSTGTVALYGALLAGGLALLSGHVTIQPTEVRATANTKWAVRVPTERPVPTTKVRLEFPAGLGAPRFMSKPGWKYEVEKNAEGAVTAVTWSGGEIPADEFDEFYFTARAPAQPGTLSFRSVQTYKSGEVVAWEQAPGERAPAPVVEVRDSTFGMPPAAGPTVSAEDEEDGEGGDWMPPLALGLSVIAVVLASIGLTRRA